MSFQRTIQNVIYFQNVYNKTRTSPRCHATHSSDWSADKSKQICKCMPTSQNLVLSTCLRLLGLLLSQNNFLINKLQKGSCYPSNFYFIMARTSFKKIRGGC